MPSRSNQRELVDRIDVKKYTTDNVKMYRLQTENYGVVGGSTLPNALRNLADSVELSSEVRQLNSLSASHLEDKEDQIATLKESSNQNLKTGRD